MARLIEKSRVETITWEDLYFERVNDVSSGFVFPAKNGHVDLDSMNDIAKGNLNMCYDHPEIFHCHGVKTHKRTYRVPPVLECDCHYKFELHGDGYYGAYQCPNCGKWYNLMGQRLNPPHMWEEDLEPDY